MDEDRIERIKKLQREGFRVPKRQSLILNNLYSLLTIVTMSLVILIYVNFILPIKEKHMKQNEQEKQRQEYFDQRAKQIALSHKLNNIQKEQTDENRTAK